MPRFSSRLAISFTSLLLSLGAVYADAPVRLLVHPTTLELHGLTDRQRVLVTAVTAEGRLTDVTNTATFTNSRPDVAALLPGGECQAKRDGETVLTIRHARSTVALPITVRDTGTTRPPSFLNDVMPLFTRLGCNQGACHGKGAGQNGFRLSLRGYAPKMDYEWLTREFEGRRVSAAVPEDSLLLRKTLGLAPHEGGILFPVGSRPHQVLLGWLRAGMPGPKKTDPEVRKLVILPGNRTLRPGQRQQLLVRAEYSDGQRRDVTWLSKFDSNDAGMAEVDAEGLVHIRRHGETAIRVSFQGLGRRRHCHGAVRASRRSGPTGRAQQFH